MARPDPRIGAVAVPTKDELGELIPIDKVGMLTDVNPNELYW